jgi:antitoxin component YwqK of YwqJK toxin-antitoxin module
MRRLLITLTILVLSPFISISQVSESSIIPPFDSTELFVGPDSEGFYRLFYKNKQLREKGKFVKKAVNPFFRKLVPDGYWIKYYESGVIKEQGSYHKGNKDGIWEYFDENGSLVKVALFKRGREIDRRVYIKEEENEQGIYKAD